MDIDIRRAVKQDIPQLEELLYQVHKIHSDKRPDIFIPGEKKYTTEELIKILDSSNTPVYVAVDGDDKVYGYVFCIFKRHDTDSMTDIKTLYIDDLCVTESARGQKIGSKLYNYVLDIAKQNECYNVTLNVWECNETAKKFYDRCGLKIQRYGMEQIIGGGSSGKSI